MSGTGGGPPTQDLTTAEELALELNKGKPVMEGTQWGTATDSGPARETGLFIQGTLLPYYCTWKTIKYLDFVMWTVWLCLTLQCLVTHLHFWSHQTMIRWWLLFIKIIGLARPVKTINTSSVEYGRGKAHLPMMRSCHWTPEGLRCHVNFV